MAAEAEEVIDLGARVGLACANGDVVRAIGIRGVDWFTSRA